MKRCKSGVYMMIKRMLSVLIVLSMVTMVPGGMPYVSATEESEQSEAITQTCTNENATTNTDPNGALGKNTDIGIEVTKSITGKAGKNIKVAFVLKSADSANIKLKSVYPVIDSDFPFETSGDAYKVVNAGSDTDKQKKLSASFKLKARSDIESGYHSVRFIGEYTKASTDGTVEDFYVVKTINIYFEDNSVSVGGDDDPEDPDDSDIGGGSNLPDEEEEVAAPKLIITGYDTDPKTIMAGDTFKLTIHIQNTSKTTPVCNGKFLIGNEAGTFLPTSGSSAVFIEKIPAGETGDLEIELKTSADLAQKNYILVVKGDFDDGKGNNFTSSDNLSIPVYQEVRLTITDVTMSPEALGIGAAGSLMFTINNQSNAGIHNVTVSIKDDAVTGEDAYVGNIAASSSAYATLNVTGAKDNSENGSIKVVISYEDSAGNAGTIEENIPCLVGEDVEVPMDSDWDDEFTDEFDDEESGFPIWLIILIIVLVVVIIVVITVTLVVRKKKRMAQLLEDEDDIMDEELGEDDLKNEDF